MAWGGQCRCGSDQRRRGSGLGSAWAGDVEAGGGDVDNELQTGVER